MSTFGAWAAGPGGTWVTVGCLFVLAVILAYLAGCRWGERRARDDRRGEAEGGRWVSALLETDSEAMARQAAMARRTHPVYRTRPPGPPGTVITEPLTPAAHTAWQALALTGDDPTVTAWTQAMAQGMDAWLAEHVYGVPYSADELWSGQ